MVSRYGRKIRELEKSALRHSRGKHVCPKCGKRNVKRVGAGIWNCSSCNARFAGGAYSPETEAGSAARRGLKAGSQPFDAKEE